MPLTFRAASAVLLVLAAFSPAAAQDQTLQNPADGGPAAVFLEAEHVLPEMSISLDGRMEEASWARATPITDFTQQEPVEGGIPSQKTEVRVLFDQDALYIGAIIYDDPDGVIAFQRQRDAYLMTDDRFMWILDTFNDGRTGYFFEINPAGLMGDGLITGGGGGGGRGGRGWGGGGMNKAWDGIWEARTASRPNGWSAEIRIPFRTLNFDPDADHWGINFQRTIRRNNEEILWRGWRRTEGLNKPIFAGDLVGLQEHTFSRGYGLEMRGSGIASWRNVPDAEAPAEPTTFPRDISLDVNYNITPSLRASLSVNTDFAEVESDERRVNLTRFPQRFRERRDFFLEGSGVFSFASRSGPQPFFSRRIGLDQGQAIPIEYGTRVTGQAGNYELGFYQIGTGIHEFPGSEGIMERVSREQFSVARVKRRIFEQSTIGAIYTRRATAASDPLADGTEIAPADRHTAGVDLAFNTRHFLGDNNMALEAFYVWNSNPDPTVVRTTRDLSAHGFRVNFPNDIWSGHISYRQFGDDYSPAVGFVPRNDFRRVEPRIGWAPRPDIDWLRRLDFAVQFRNLTELGTGIVEEREWNIDILGIDFESGDGISFNAKRIYEYLDFGYDIVDEVHIAAGEYTNWEYSVRGNTAGRRRVSLFGSITTGGFWDGQRTRYGGRVSFRPNPGISISTNIEYNTAQMPVDDFSTSVYELEGEWNPDPWISFTNQLQYDNGSQIVGFFARMRWIVNPGNDIYLVYTHNWRNCSVASPDAGCSVLDINPREDPWLMTLSRGGALKLNYTYRF